MLVGNIRLPERCPNRETRNHRLACIQKSSVKILGEWLALTDAWIMAKLWLEIDCGKIIWLLVSTPLKNMKVSWKYYSQYMESHKIHVPNHQPVMVMVESSWKPPLTIGDSSRLHTWAHSLGISWQTLADQKNAWPVWDTSSIHWGWYGWMILDTHKRQGKTYFWYWCKTL